MTITEKAVNSGITKAGVTQARTGVTQARTGVTRTRLHVTRRGRAICALAVFLLSVCAVGFALNGGTATATTDVSAVTLHYVTVKTGESLWSLARSLAPSLDLRDVIDDFVRFNQLSSTSIHAGQQLAIPPKYVR